MTTNSGEVNTVSKSVLEWLTTIGGIAGIIFNLLSLFVDEKPAKQISLGLAFIVPLGAFWYQQKTASKLSISVSSENDVVKDTDRLLKQYLALYKIDQGLRIPYHHLQKIRKHASAKLLASESVQKLIKSSSANLYWATSINFTLAILFIITLYAFLTTSYQFNPVDYFFGKNRIQKENLFVFMDKGSGVMVFGSDNPNLESGDQPRNDNMPIDDFSIQKTEVTNKQYRSCRRAGACNFDPVPSPTSIRYYEDPAYDNYPVVGLTAFQAREFCVWLGGDLPTNTQWERAARGLYGRAWPWQGEDLTAEKANLYPAEQIVNVNEFSSGTSPEGVLNLVGNVAEWTRTQLITKDGGASFLPELWNGETKDVALAIRGGNWGLQMWKITDTQIAIPENFDEFTGFRCTITEK